MPKMGVFFAGGMCFDTSLEGNGGRQPRVSHCAKVRAGMALRRRTGAMQHLGYELPRIPLPRTLVNKAPNAPVSPRRPSLDAATKRRGLVASPPRPPPPDRR